MYMKKLFCSLSLAFWFSAVLVGCDRPADKPATPILNTKVTRENVAKLHEGMNRTQVVALLGEPTTSEIKDMVIFKKNTVTYVEGKDSIEIIYKNDEVQEVHSTLTTTGTTTTTTTTTSKTE